MSSESDIENSDQEFQTVFNQYWESIGDEGDDRGELSNQILTMIEQRQAPPKSVIHTFATMLTKHPSKKFGLFHIMRDIAYHSKKAGGYTFPEFFWLMIQSGVLSEPDKVYDATKYLCVLGNPHIVRAFLTTTLITAEAINYHAIIRSFYHVGHTVDSLQIVERVIPLAKENQDVYFEVFAAAKALCYRSKDTNNPLIQKRKPLSDDEESYLVNFFKRGLLLESPQISEICREALAMLKE